MLSRDVFKQDAVSGTVSEESAMPGFLAVTFRDDVEPAEGSDAGTVVTSGIAPDGVTRSVRALISDDRARLMPGDDGIPDTRARLVRLILSTDSRHHDWAGIRP